MQPLRLALAPNGPKRLEVAWRGRWKDLTLTLDGAPVLTVPTEAELKAGREVRTQAGTLAVQLKTPAFGRELWLTLDGRPIPQTAADPAKRLQQSYGVLYLVAGLSVALGAAATVFEVGPLADMGFGWLSIAFGAVIALLAVGVHRSHSLVALSLAIGILGLDGVLGIVGAIRGGGSAPMQGIVIRVLVLLWVSRGFGALRELREQEGR